MNDGIDDDYQEGRRNCSASSRQSPHAQDHSTPNTRLLFNDDDSIMNVTEFLQARGSDLCDGPRRGTPRRTASPMSPEDDLHITSYNTIDSVLDSLPSTPHGSPSGVSRRPSASAARRMCRRIPAVVALLFLPLYIGAVLVGFSWDRRRRAAPLFVNRRDWVPLAFVGVTSQLSLIPALLNFLPTAKETFQRLHSPSDYYAPFVLYPVSSVFLCVVAVAYTYLEKKSQRKRRIAVSHRRRSKLQTIYAHLTSCIEYPSEYIAPVVLVVSILFLLLCRFCSEAGTMCSSGNQLWDPKYYSEPFFFSALMFQLCMYCVLCTFCGLAIGLYWQHKRLVQVFTFPDKYGAYDNTSRRHGSPQSPTAYTRLVGTPRSGTGTPTFANGGRKPKKGFVKEIDWHDLSHPEGISNYIVLYHQIVGSMNTHPVIVSICSPAFTASVVICCASLAVVVVDNMYQGHGVADFTFVFLTLTVISTTCITLFIVLTVQLDKTIGLQSRIIALVQNDVQLQVDAKRLRAGVVGPAAVTAASTATAASIRVLEAKVNALQALDVFVRQADSTPKLIGMSLNTIRWTTIIVLLIFINAFFILLYRIYCFDVDDSSTPRTRTQTIAPPLNADGNAATWGGD